MQCGESVDEVVSVKLRSDLNENISFQSLQSLHFGRAGGRGAIGRVSWIYPSRENSSLHSRRPVRPVRAAPVCTVNVRANSRCCIDFACNRAARLSRSVRSFSVLNVDERRVCTYRVLKNTEIWGKERIPSGYVQKQRIDTLPGGKKVAHSTLHTLFSVAYGAGR